jgi:hypothetical protein
MIRLRLRIERGMRHPVVGPLLVVLVALMLVFVGLHGSHDSHDLATELSAVCLGLVSLLGVLLLIRVGRAAPAPVMLVRMGRAPPVSMCSSVLRPLIASPLRL